MISHEELATLTFTVTRERRLKMGEIADMMIEGYPCNGCGSSLVCESFGIPILCHSCHSEYQDKCSIPHEGESGYYCERYYK